VRLTHWIITASFLTLVYTGYVILMAHPRLYWGETGNDLTPALIELPISKNYKHGGWENRVSFFAEAGSPVSASRTFEIFNENGWGRSLHFLAAWCLVIPGALYLLIGIFTGHFRSHVVPRTAELSPRLFWREFVDHVRFQIRAASGGPQYGLLQKCAYVAVVFVALPLAAVTGLAMSPTITAAYPFLAEIFGGSQSARTIHFFLALALVLFLAAHVLMVIKSGFKRQMRAMTIGE
jgi:thiosulfate reductase cytochrome b subunit